MSDKKKALFSAILFGVGSLALYALLFAYADQLVAWAQQTRQGHKSLFLVPIAIAFLFSWVHGSFTSHFWDALGIRAASKHK